MTKPAPAKWLSVLATQAQPAKTVTSQGREFMVVSAVMVRSQVLHNNLGKTFLPAEALTPEWAQSWNHVPVLASDHPTVRGVAVSARDPEILDKHGVGSVYRARIEKVDGVVALKAEVWLDKARVAEVPELADIFAALSKGKPVELSTGFPVMIENKTGIHDGSAYDYVLHPMGTDHLAIFAGSTKGACSVTHGCGLGINHSGACADPKKKPAVATRKPKEPAVQSQSWLMRLLSRLGVSREMVENETSDDDRRMLLGDALRVAFGGLGRDVWLCEVFSDESYAVFEVMSNTGPMVQPGYGMGAGRQLYRVGYTLSDDGKVSFGEPKPVVKRTKYEDVPVVANSLPSLPQTEEEQGMDRKKVIAQMAAAGPLSEAELTKLTDCQLSALQSAGGSPAAEPPKGEKEAAEKIETLTASVNKLVETVGTLAKATDDQQKEIVALRGIAAPIVAEQEAEREELIAALAAKEGEEGFTKEELSARTSLELRKLAALSGRMQPQVSYAGRGGPKGAQATNVEPSHMEPKPYWDDAYLATTRGARA